MNKAELIQENESLKSKIKLLTKELQKADKLKRHHKIVHGNIKFSMNADAYYPDTIVFYFDNPISIMPNASNSFRIKHSD